MHPRTLGLCAGGHSIRKRRRPLNAAHKVIPVIVLLAVLSFSASASAQTGLGHIGPTGAQVAGAAVGVGAVIGIILYLTLHKPSMTGCVRSADGAYTITDQNAQVTYTLVDATPGLKSGERVKLQGKKKKDKQGNLTFRMKKIKRDYGPCQQ